MVHTAPAGYFLWVDLRGVDATSLRDACLAAHGVSFLPGARCSRRWEGYGVDGTRRCSHSRAAARATGSRCALESDVAPTRARVCFAFYEEEELAEAGQRLGRAIAVALAERA